VSQHTHTHTHTHARTHARTRAHTRARTLTFLVTQIGRQHLRNEKNERHLQDLLPAEEVHALHEDTDPVLYCMYKVRGRGLGVWGLVPGGVWGL
jgi:hypothetical protein